MDNDNISLANLPKDIKSQLRKASWQKRRQMNILISNNIGKLAQITVRPNKPTTLLARLHNNHSIQVNAGWIQSITILGEKQQEQIEKQIKELGNKERVQEIEEK